MRMIIDVLVIDEHGVCIVEPTGMRTLTLLYCITFLTSVLVIGCKSKSSSTSSERLPTIDKLIICEVAELSVKLPSEPETMKVDLSPSVRKFIQTLETFKTAEGTPVMATVTHVIYTVPEASLEGSADGAITEVSGLPGAASFVSAKEGCVVDGLPGVNIVMTYNNSGHELIQYCVVFVRKNELWQVQLVGVDVADRGGLEILRDEIYASIKVLS